MAFDGIVTKSIINELQYLIGSKIDKIYEPNKNTIILGLYHQGKNFALNICIDAHNCRINLTTHPKPNPLVAPNFCMLLRKHLLGGKISNISMTGLERVVRIDIETINEFNEIELKTLIIELMGKHSNIILINNKNIIIDSMRHISINNHSYRDISPSFKYVFPESNKIDFTKLKNFDEFYSNLVEPETNLSKSISNAYTGFSLSFVKSCINECENNINLIYNYICDIINNPDMLSFKKINENDYSLILSPSNDNFSLNFFIDDFYYERETKETFVNYKNNIFKIISDISKKYNNRLISINKKLDECANMDQYRLYGELITANLYKLTNTHTNFIELENYYDNNNLIKIPLDIRYSPNINAKHYFKKYSKLKNALTIVSKQKTETELELNYIDSVIYELDNCTCLEDIQEIYEEIKENVIFKPKFKNKKKEKTQKKKEKQIFNPLKFEINGFQIFVGRNNKENDWLTTSFANKNDIWFHTKDIHGSHVILKNTQPITDEILIKCAKLAAKYSKAYDSSNVPVDYCFVQFVKKPNGAKPGMVIFTNNKTLNVNPLED